MRLECSIHCTRKAVLGRLIRQSPGEVLNCNANKRHRAIGPVFVISIAWALDTADVEVPGFYGDENHDDIETWNEGGIEIRYIFGEGLFRLGGCESVWRVIYVPERHYRGGRWVLGVDKLLFCEEGFAIEDNLCL